MAEIDLKTTSRTVRSAIVSVYDEARNLLRSYRISGAEYDDQISGRTRFPPGVTRAEWESGLVCMGGVGVEVGEIDQKANGDLMVIIGERARGGIIHRDYLEIPADAYSGTPPKITLHASVVLDNGETSRTISVVDGKASWQ